MKKTLIAIFTTAIILTLIGLSYAYFTGRVIGDKKELLVTSKNIRIVFTDEREISNGGITPGWKDSKTFSVKNESNNVFYYNIIFENLVNTFVTEGFLQYKITSTDGGYSSEGYLDIPKSSTPTDVILASNIELPIDVTHNYTVEFVYHNSDTVNQNEDQGKIFEGNLFITEGEKISKTLADKLKSDYKPKPGRTDFSVIDDGEAALYTGTDDQGTTYYFSGDGTDMRNWVSFAGKLWRVIRINGNGSVRLLYAGSGGEDGYIGSAQTYNNSDNHPGYVGWKYSTGSSLDAIRENANKSNAYTTVENWYNALSSTDKNYIDNEAIYCNDRELRFGDTFSVSNSFYYAAYGRIREKPHSLTLKCSNSSDRFNTFGLMTADEIVFSGGSFYRNNSQAYYYLAKDGSSSVTGNNNWCTMTPAFFFKSIDNRTWADIFYVSGFDRPGYFDYSGTTSQYVVRPVVSLKSCVDYIGGDGSSSDPYKVNITGKCGGYSVEVNVTNGSSEGAKNVEEGSNVEFEITPNEGYSLSNVVISGEGCPSTLDDGKLIINNVTSNLVCNVELRKKTYTVNVSVNSSVMGSVSPSSSSVEHGSDLNVTIRPSSGYKYLSNTCGGNVSGNVMTISNVTENKNCSVTFVKDNTLVSKLKEAYPPKPGRTDFSVIDDGEAALYTGTDDQGTTYYFSGYGLDMKNWVSYAGKKWRVIRINGNGSVRLLYAGSGGTDGYIGKTQAYNSSFNHPGYVGWKYATGSNLAGIRGTTKSNAYEAVESWYNVLSSTDKNYIDTEAIYCNDRELTPGNSFGTNNTFYYAAYRRLVDNKKPSFKCSNSSDRFKMFGLMTADEVVFAGGRYGHYNLVAYYYFNTSGGSSTGSNYWWTMTPYEYTNCASELYCSGLFVVYGNNNGGLGNAYVHANYVIRPVISLKKEVLVTGGSGTGNDPYIVSMPWQK